MTEREQRELKTLLDRARIAHGRPLTNAETNSVKKEYIDKLMASVKPRQKSPPDKEKAGL
jgi:FMN-dependent NADH-azoreductase